MTKGGGTVLFFLTLLLVITIPARSGVLLDDIWADGTRTDTALPNETAWFASSGASLTSAAGSMTGITGGTSSRTWWAHFTTNAAAPVQLAVGDTLKVTLAFTPDGVNAANANRNLRIGLFDFSGGSRTTADGGSPAGAGVKGYLLNMNFAQAFGTTPMEIKERTAIAGTELMANNGDFTTLGTGGGSSGERGFSNGVPYRLEFSVTRNIASMTVTTIFSDGNGWSITTTATDTNTLNTAFDGFALRPANTTATAATFLFTEFKVEMTSVATAPSITTQPQARAVTMGQDAELSVVAAGTAPLAYQWHFNTNSVIPGATNATLTLTNCQVADAGSYSVIVTNPFGSATSAVAVLTVNQPVAPAITNQPQNQTATVGQGVTFSVGASGSSPLVYQWFKESSAIANATNSVLALGFAQTTDAGGYSVIVSNSAGSATSIVATLTVNVPTATARDFRITGFASLDGFASNGTFRAGGTTGGAGGVRVQATNAADLVKHLQSDAALLVEVMNDIDLSALANNSGGFPVDYPTGEITVRSHKTIYSKKGSTISRGSLRIGKPSLGPQQNIIIRNLKFRDLWVFDPSGNYDTYGWDYVHVEEGSHHIWVDHCDFDQVYDGMIDLTHGSDLMTVSWCVFRNQKKCQLIGSSDNNGAEDTGHLNITLHHNWYVNVDERMPRMRFGNAHVYNLYSENLGGRGIQSTANAATLVENSFFRFPKAGSKPTVEENGGPTGTVKVVSCVISNLPGVNVVFREFGQASFRFNPPFASPLPPYPYVADPVTNVANLVTNYAGVGKVGFELWQMEQFTPAQLTNAAVSGADAAPANDAVSNFGKYALGLPPFIPAAAPLTPLRMEGGEGVLTYRRPATATDVTYRVQVSSNLTSWVESGISHQLIGTDSNGLQNWEARFTGPAANARYFRLRLER